jgi:hypothetical protein
VNGKVGLNYAQVVQLIQQSETYLHLLVVPKEDDLLQRVSSTLDFLFMLFQICPNEY